MESVGNCLIYIPCDGNLANFNFRIGPFNNGILTDFPPCDHKYERCVLVTWQYSCIVLYCLVKLLGEISNGNSVKLSLITCLLANVHYEL